MVDAVAVIPGVVFGGQVGGGRRCRLGEGERGQSKCQGYACGEAGCQSNSHHTYPSISSTFARGIVTLSPESSLTSSTRAREPDSRAWGSGGRPETSPIWPK